MGKWRRDERANRGEVVLTCLSLVYTYSYPPRRPEYTQRACRYGSLRLSSRTTVMEKYRGRKSRSAFQEGEGEGVTIRVARKASSPSASIPNKNVHTVHRSMTPGSEEMMHGGRERVQRQLLASVCPRLALCTLLTNSHTVPIFIARHSPTAPTR